MREIARSLVRIAQRTYRVCRFCGYSGSDWPDSGECPGCGETN